MSQNWSLAGGVRPGGGASQEGGRPCRSGTRVAFRRFSVDEGHTWSTHNFTSTSVFVDGLLSEPGDETLVMT